MQTIAIASGKGGVGKSTVTTQLAAILANNGYKVGVIDADIYGSCQYNLLSGTESEPQLTDDNKILPGYSQKHKIYYISVNNIIPNVDETPMLWRAPIATKLIREFLQQVAWPELDFLLLDLPPGTGDIQITIAQLAKLDGAIIVTTPQKVAYNIAAKAIQMFNKVNVKIIGIVENMSGYVCNNCNHTNNIFNHHGGTILAEKYQAKLLGTIPLSHSLVTISDDGDSILHLPQDNTENQNVLSSYFKLTENLLLNLTNTSNKANAHDTKKTKIYKLLSNDTLQINTDNLSVNIKAYDLRLNCPCALCKEETTGITLINKNIISKDIIITNIHEVGNYGLRLTFSDGHGTGIYQFDTLENLSATNT